MRFSIRILAPLTATAAALAGIAPAAAANGEVSGSSSAVPLYVVGIGFFLAVGLGSAYMFFRKPPSSRDDDASEDPELES